MSDLQGATILITGGTGSFGQAFSQHILSHNPKRVIIYSRDEMKQWEMAKTHTDKRIKFFIGDVRDRERLQLAMHGVTHIVHAAALKIVPAAEYNPFECIKTNVLGAMNVTELAARNGVKQDVALSTDKASAPINLYGATKLCSDKLFIASNSYSETKFAVVRYGNVMGSRGSVIPFFRTIKDGDPVPITHPDMTRFMITMTQAIELVEHAFRDMEGGEIYVPKIPSMHVTEIARTLKPNSPRKIIGMRPGEKIHEQMIGPEDAPFTYEYYDYFKILPSIYDWHSDQNRIKTGIKVPKDFSYSSNENLQWMQPKELLEWVEQNDPV